MIDRELTNTIFTLQASGTSRGVEYLPLASLLPKTSSSSRPRDLIAVVCESAPPQAIGGRGEHPCFVFPVNRFVNRAGMFYRRYPSTIETRRPLAHTPGPVAFAFHARRRTTSTGEHTAGLGDIDSRGKGEFTAFANRVFGLIVMPLRSSSGTT